MMMPKNIYVVHYDGKYLGHVGPSKSCIFGFIKRADALAARQSIKYQPVDTKKYTSNCYLLKVTPQVNPKKPINKSKIYVTTLETMEVIVESLIHNVKVELIDGVEKKNEDVVLFSNFDISVDVSDRSILNETLNAMVEDREPNYTFDINLDIESGDIFNDE